MLDLIKNSVTSIQERLRSPFYFAFIVSWIFINWDIVVGFWKPEFTLSNGETLTTYIQTKINLYKCLFHPLWVALCYILAINLIDLLTGAYVELIRSFKRKVKIKIMGWAPVAGQDYVELYKETEKAKNRIQEVLSNMQSDRLIHGQVKSELMDFKEKWKEIEIQRKRLAKELEDCKQNLNTILTRKEPYEIFTGEWKVKYRKTKGIDYEIEFFNIDNNNQWIYIESNNKGNPSYSTIFKMELFTFDEHNQRMKYLKYGMGENNNQWRMGEFEITNNRDIFIGWESFGTTRYEVILEKHSK